MRPEVKTSALLLLGTFALTSACGGASSDAPPAANASSAAHVGEGSSAAPRGAAPPGEGARAPSAREADARAAEALAKFLTRFLELSPVEATQLGDHSHDGEWPDVSKEALAERARFFERTRADLAKLPREALSRETAVDVHTVDHALAYRLFLLQEERRHENDPLYYTSLVGDGLDPLVTRGFAPLPQRLLSITARLRGLPALLDNARKNLTAGPKLHTETAIRQTGGLLKLVSGQIREAAAQVKEQEPHVTAASTEATRALEEFRTFLEKELLPKAKDDFRLGKALYAKKLRFELDDDVDEGALAKEARTLLEETQSQMYETAREALGEADPRAGKAEAAKNVDPKTLTLAQKKVFVRKVLAKLAEDRPTNKTIVDEAKKLLVATTRFVREKDLVRIPEEPCEVIEMPEYKRGVAIAYCDTTGPLEKKHESVYAIAPTPKDWPPKRVTSFYQEYNRSMLAELTIHEAMPGHYLQGMHAVRFPSAVRAIFSSGPFVEGWAVYAEWLMARHGYGGAKVRLQREKMLLRLLANAIVDHDTHAGTMTEKEALALMMDEAFQEEGEAVAKWSRARLTSAQLSTYFYGYREMMRLRREAENSKDFRERTFNDELIAHGAPSMRSLRLLLADKLGIQASTPRADTVEAAPVKADTLKADTVGAGSAQGATTH